MHLQLASRVRGQAAAAAKLWTTEMEGRVCDECVQLHGGFGYLAESAGVEGAPEVRGALPVGCRFVNARITRIYGGSNEVMRQIVARSLGLDKKPKARL